MKNLWNLKFHFNYNFIKMIFVKRIIYIFTKHIHDIESVSTCEVNLVQLVSVALFVQCGWFSFLSLFCALKRSK